jgi:hypothetical protein
MRHGCAGDRLGRVTLLVVHALAVAFLTGLSWVVQVVVYPSFRVVGPTAAWPAFHAAHSRGLVRAVGLPWAVQGVTLAALLVDRPDGVPPALALLAGALGAATVALTVLGAVPQHQRLTAYDDEPVRTLLVVHAWRTAAWTAGLVVAGSMIATAS